jgi:pyrimidine-nucleoside phosphorylase
VAPADRRLYALRDVTGTVESIPLISASIMSKKIAEGIGGLVLDVKTGEGAFMKTLADSIALARSLVSIGNASGVRTEAVITAMDAPLGNMIGNSLEVIESADVLKGNGPKDLEDLSVLLAARMLVLAGLDVNEASAISRARAAISSGKALEIFGRVIENQGGDRRVLEDYSLLPSAPDESILPAPRRGYVGALKAEAIGRAAVALGAGRARIDDVIDPAVGIRVAAHVGAEVARGDAVLVLRHRAGRGVSEAMDLLQDAIRIDDEPPPAISLIVDRITEDR